MNADPQQIEQVLANLVSNAVNFSGRGTKVTVRAIVQKIADAHGGRIEVESQPGRGSTFALLLPLAAGGGNGGRGERI